MKYKRDPVDNSIFTRFYVPEANDVIEFRASKLQTNGKGSIQIIHETPQIERQGLGTHYFTLDNGRERLWLANHAFSNLNGVGPGMTKTFMGLQLDEFAVGVFNWDTSDITSELVAGDPAWRPKFLAFPYILEGGMTILTGPPGATKSSTGIALAISVDSGIDKLWPIETSGPALLINMERSRQSIAGRIGFINECLSTDEFPIRGDRPLEVFHTAGKTLAQVEATLRRIVAEKGIYFAVLDSLSRTGMGNLNDNEPANAIMDMMANIFPTSLILAHSPKDGKGTFGSQMFLAAADVEVQIETNRLGQDMTSWTKYTISKANDLGVLPTLWFAFDYRLDHNDDPRIQTSRLVDIRIPSPDEIPDFSVEQYLTDFEKILRFLNEHTSGTSTDIAEGTGLKPSKVRAELKRKKGTYFNQIDDDSWTTVTGNKHQGSEAKPDLFSEGLGILSRTPRLEESRTEYLERRGAQ